MTALASTDITLTIQQRVREGKKRRNRVKIAFGDAALTYPAGGVPLPTFGSWGMKRNLDFLILTDTNDASGIVWKYDQENRKLRGYIQGAVVGPAGAVTMDDFPLDATADPLVSAGSISLLSSVGSGTKYFGAMKELATGAAPVAQVLYAEAVGF